MLHGRLLVADSNDLLREALTAALRQEGHEVDDAAECDEALARLREVPYDLLLLDLELSPTGGIAVLQQVKSAHPSVPVMVIGSRGDKESVLAAFRNGALDYVDKPISTERARELAARAVSIRQKGERRRRLSEELEGERQRVQELEEKLAHDDPFERIAGHSQPMRQLLDTVREVARTDSTVLLTGESGTGKGLVARTIHSASSRRAAPFVQANCVVYSEGVLHSELFGHERGAFTGAARTKKGRFELARGGTLFLDEIGEISQSTQLLLLRVLQERTFERVGGEETLEADVRMIAATNRDLQQAIDQGAFRSDLFYRLNVIPVHLPALRDHVEDVPVLAQRFLAECAERLDREIRGFTPESIDALMRYPWPGNVRELENVVERIVVLNRTGIVEAEDLPPALRGEGGGPRVGTAAGTLQTMERLRIVEALREAGGNKKRAAVALGIHRSTLYAKMSRHGIDVRNGAVVEECSEERREASPIATAASSS